MEEESTELSLRGAMAPLLALFLPFMLWPVEWLLPYPAFIEETAKLVIVVWVVRNTPSKMQTAMVLGCGILFAASETLLYIVNAAQYGNLAVLGWRLILTVPMHVLTFMILLWAVKVRLWWAGLALAMLIHWGFNFLAGR